jgi:Domain of unknown function (DUF1851)
MSRLTISPHLALHLNADTLDAALEAWRWKIGEPNKVLLTTLFGDIFYENDAGYVLWLNSGAGSVEKIAASESEFHQLLETDAADIWLLQQLAERLQAGGKVLAAEQCYTLITPPVFEEGKYEVSNIAVVSAIEHFRFTADLHQQIANLPDGAHVRFKMIE